MARWYRAYEGTVTDPKLGEAAMMANCSRSVAVATWHMILEAAASADEGGRFDCSARRIGVALVEPLDVIERVLCAFTEIGLVAGDVVSAWAHRQYETDRSAKRTRQWREKRKKGNENENVTSQPVTCDVTETSLQRHCDGPESETETEYSVANATGEISPRTDRAEAQGNSPSPSPDHRAVGHTESGAVQAVPSALDVTKAIFDTGTTILKAAGVQDRQARSIIGRWRKIYQDGPVLAVLSRAQVLGPSEPVEWITAALKAERQQATGERYGQELARAGERPGSIVGIAQGALGRLELADRG